MSLLLIYLSQDTRETLLKEMHLVEFFILNLLSLLYKNIQEFTPCGVTSDLFPPNIYEGGVNV